MPPSDRLKETFERLLATCVKHAASHDDLAKRLFHDGDAAHLNRWLNYGGADKTWKKIYKGPFDLKKAFDFIMSNLRLRALAERSDIQNKELAALEQTGRRAAAKERKHAIKLLTNSEITPTQFAAHIAHIEETVADRPTKFLGPLLSVRCDKNGTRRRTLFCRMLSGCLYAGTGQWHDTEVHELCEIAFDCNDVTIEMVRSARRESTRKTRKRR